MAIGDDATAAGFNLVAGTADRRDGYNQINKTRDYIAQLKTWATLQLTGKAATIHNHDDRYDTSAEVTAKVAAVNLSGKADAYGNTSSVRLAEGPTGSAYARPPTGSSWFATWMNSDLLFMRNTSSRRYKTAEKPLDLDPRAILAMVPTTYHRKGQPRGTRELGLIAEDLAALDLPHIVTWDQERDKAGKVIEGSPERPEAVRYEQVLPVMLLHVCRDLQAQIDQLRKQENTTTKETP